MNARPVVSFAVADGGLVWRRGSAEVELTKCPGGLLGVHQIGEVCWVVTRRAADDTVGLALVELETGRLLGSHQIAGDVAADISAPAGGLPRTITIVRANGNYNLTFGPAGYSVN